VLDDFQQRLGARYSTGEVRAIACAVFNDGLGWDAGELMMNRELALSDDELARVSAPLARLQAGEPLQYVLGSTTFHGLRINVGPTVLIPRPETEELVDRIIRAQARPPERIIDIGTGSGCIALALKRAFPEARVIGVDISSDALDMARRNASENDLQVEWRLLDVLVPDASIGEADIIVSNPPYVPRRDEAGMQSQVREHEPHLALFVEDDDPLLFFRTIAQLGLRSLLADGQLWFEGHHQHTREIPAMLLAMGYAEVQLLNDLSGQARFISARR
jgi:release factor glutamine methyltransferase